MQHQAGIILLTVLIYILLMNMLILATYELVQINYKVSHAMMQQQILSQAAETNINIIESNIQKNQLPTCTQAWKNANSYYQQTPTDWQNQKYCSQQKDKVSMRYVVELAQENLCEITSTSLQAQRYRLTQFALLDKMVNILQTTGVFASKTFIKDCSKPIVLDLGRHSWRE